MRFSASNSSTQLATHSDRFCLYSVQDGRQSSGIGAKRFVPEVTSLLSINRGEGLRSHLTWSDGGFDDGGDGWGDGLTRMRLGGLGTDIGFIVFERSRLLTHHLCIPSSV